MKILCAIIVHLESSRISREDQKHIILVDAQTGKFNFAATFERQSAADASLESEPKPTNSDGCRVHGTC